MAGHANVVGEPRFKLRRIHDRVRGAFGARIAFAHFAHVRFSRTVAVFAADGQFTKWRIHKSPIAAQHCLRPTAVAGNTTGENRATETVVAELISGRESPALRFRIKGKRRFKKIVAALYERAEPIGTRSNDPIHRVRLSEHFLAVLAHFKFALEKFSILNMNTKMAMQPVVNDCGRSRNSFQK